MTTQPSTDNLPEVTVTQADRDAAADYLRSMGSKVAQEVRQGEMDRGHTAQAFARHRTEAVAAEREACAAVADGMRPTNERSDWTEFATDRDAVCYRIATAIRARNPA